MCQIETEKSPQCHFVIRHLRRFYVGMGLNLDELMQSSWWVDLGCGVPYWDGKDGLNPPTLAESAGTFFGKRVVGIDALPNQEAKHYIHVTGEISPDWSAGDIRQLVKGIISRDEIMLISALNFVGRTNPSPRLVYELGTNELEMERVIQQWAGNLLRPNGGLYIDGKFWLKRDGEMKYMGSNYEEIYKRCIALRSD